MPKAISSKPPHIPAQRSTSTHTTEMASDVNGKPRSARTSSGILNGLNCFKPFRKNDTSEAPARSSLRVGFSKTLCFGSNASVHARRPAMEVDVHANERAKWLNMQREALDKLLTAPTQPFMPGRSTKDPKSIQEISDHAGIPTDALENHIRFEIEKFISKVENNGIYYYNEFDDLADNLYNIFLESKKNTPPDWIKNFDSFESFVSEFCPQTNKNTQSKLISQVENFFGTHIPPLIKRKPDNNELTDLTVAYNGTGNWVELPQAWVDRSIVEEARRLLDSGFPEKNELFVHGTGSAAMTDFAKYQAIRSAALALETGSNVVTGEFVSYISHDGQTSVSGGKSGLKDVYTSESGLSSDCYTMQRWFNEFQVTFGISQNKQRAYNEARGIDRDYINWSNNGITVGPVVPLKNVVAISAQKENEKTVLSWIESHCPHAKFVSYEAAELLESRNLYGMLPQRPKEW